MLINFTANLAPSSYLMVGTKSYYVLLSYTKSATKLIKSTSEYFFLKYIMFIIIIASYLFS